MEKKRSFPGISEGPFSIAYYNIIGGYFSSYMNLDNLRTSLSAIAANRQWSSGNDIEKSGSGYKGDTATEGNPGGGIYVWHFRADRFPVLGAGSRDNPVILIIQHAENKNIP